MNNENNSFREEIFSIVAKEERRQQEGIELIPSENYTYPEVLELLGSVFTNKYAEGYPGARYYGGQKFTDEIETLAIETAKQLFRADHANVQPLSGSPMNQAVYFGLLEPGDTILSMDLSHGGHLTHGAPVSHMGKVFNFIRYRTEIQKGGVIDFEHIRKIARENRPKMVLCGTSSYPLEINYREFKSIADEVGAMTMADVSHVGGLIAGGVLENPLDHGFDVVTTTSHKTLRGPRGGIILCRGDFKRRVGAAVFPGLQGGPHMNNVAAIAYALRFAETAEFKRYARQVLDNSTAFVSALSTLGCDLVCGRTENHLTVINTMATFEINGKDAQEMLDAAGITTNKQVVPDDPHPAARPSGIRVGTPAGTSRGFGRAEFEQIASWIVKILRSRGNSGLIAEVSAQVKDLCAEFPIAVAGK